MKKRCERCGRFIKIPHICQPHPTQNKKLSKEWKEKIRNSSKKKEKSHSWRGGKTIKDGYIYIHCPSHPYARLGGKYVRKHRLVMEQWLQKNKSNHSALIEINGIKYLRRKWIVHHKGIKYPLSSIKNRQDNRIENLKLFPNDSKHQKFHPHSGFQIGNTYGFKKGYTPWNKSKKT